MKHPKGTGHRSHISGKRFLHSAAKRGLVDLLQDEADQLHQRIVVTRRDELIKQGFASGHIVLKDDNQNTCKFLVDPSIYKSGVTPEDIERVYEQMRKETS